MTRFADSFVTWLGDYYLLSAALLAIVVIGTARLMQPARRLAIIKATLIALALLAALCALPRWSVVHLLASKNEQLPPVFASRTIWIEPDRPARAPSVMPPREQPSGLEHAAPQTTAARSSAWPRITWAGAVTMVSICGAVVIMIWLGIGSVAAGRLRRFAAPAPIELTTLLAEISASRRDAAKWTSRPIDLLVSDRVNVPVALGIRHPAILLPAQWLREIPLPHREGQGEGSDPANNLRSVLVHELAHIQNHDLPWLATSRLLLIVLWAQPLYWYLRRRMRLDQEALADAAAAEISGRQQYAEQLVAWARDVRSRPAMHLSSAVGLWERPSQLRRRVALLLDERLNVIRDCSRRWRIASLAICVIAAGGLSLFTVQPGESAPPSELKREQPKNSASHAETSSQGEAEPPLELAASRSADEEGANTFSGVYVASGLKPGTPNTIEGQCVDENGKPLADVEVVVNRVWFQDAARREAVAKQTTHADGKFHFDNVVDVARVYPTGKVPKLPDFAAPYFQVAARRSGRVSVAEVVAQNDIARQGSRQKFKIPPAATLRGRITNTKGEPVAGALVSVGFSQLDRWEGFQSVRSGSDGRYEINDAPPFDSKNVEKTQTFGVGKQDELVFPRVIFVEHPNFASRAVHCKKIPGMQNVQLKAAAIITGRVIDGTTKQPVANAAVQALPNQKNSTLWDVATSYAFVKTDVRGEYRITTLPEGTYDLWAVAPNRVNEGVKKLKTSAEQVTSAPDLVMTGGGMIRVRLIDEKTGKPIPINGDERAQINVTPSPPMTAQDMVEVKNGRFEVRTLPDEVRIDSVTASSNDAIKWIIRSASPVTVLIVEGKSTDADVRVQDISNLERFNSISRLMSRALEERLSDEHKAIADFEQAIKLDPPYPLNVGVHSCLALILATSADDSVRDGKRAVELAQKAQQFEDKPSAFVLEALAAAHAEVGDFDRAVANEKEAIELAKKEQNGEPPTDYLKLYEAHKPRREPRKNTGQKANNDQGASKKPSARKPTGVKKANRDVPITVTGRTIDDKGQPISGSKVYMASPRGRGKPLATTISDNDGKYRFEGVRLPIESAPGKEDVGSFEVFAEANGFGLAWRPLKWFYPDTAHAYRSPIDEPSWDLPQSYGTDDPIELDLHFGPAASLRGRIVNDAREPIANASLAIRSAQPLDDQHEEHGLESLNWESLVPEAIKVRQSDKDGRFEFTALPANYRFWIDVRPPGYTQRGIYAATQSGPQENVDGIPVFAHDFEAVFARPRTVKLQVLYGDTQKPARKVGVGGNVTEAGFWMTTDDNGLVDVPLPDGRYKLGISPRPGTPYMKTEVNVAVSADSANKVTTLMLHPGAVVDMQVVDADTNEPLSGVDVWIDDQGPGAAEPHRRVHGYRSWEVETRISHYDSPTSDEKGKMRVLFEPGKHRIGIGLQKFPKGYEPVEPNGKLVELEVGKPQSIQFQMRKHSQSRSASPVKFQLVQNTTPVADRAEPKRPANILAYGDDKPDGKKSYGSSGHMIRFELPEGVTKIKGIRIHGSRYGLPQAPKEDFEITFLNEKRDETLHSETAPYSLFNRGKEQWVRVAFKNEVELPRTFWIALNFNARQTKGVYVSYDTSTKGEYSRVGLPGDKEEPKETDFHGDWMVQVLLSPAKK